VVILKAISKTAKASFKSFTIMKNKHLPIMLSLKERFGYMETACPEIVPLIVAYICDEQNFKNDPSS
jgi:hypothetical protein